jgi:hypothetical protein
MVLQYPATADRKWVASLSAAAGAYSPAKIIPGFVDDLVALVKPDPGGQVALEFTADDEDVVDSDPGSVTWIQWNVGFVTINTAQTALGAVTAVRIRALTQPATCSRPGNRRTIRR